MKGRFTQALALAAGLGFVISGTVLAHHGDAGRYEPFVVTVTGTVVVFQLTNPHSTLVLDVPDEEGNLVRWRGEWSGATALRNRGMQERISVGDTITMTGRPLRSGQPYMILTVCSEVIDGDGEVLHEGNVPEDDPDCQNIPSSTGGGGPAPGN